MTRYVALLRAINLGSHNRIAMPALTGLVEALGHRDVRTYVQSGNVVFTSGSRNAATVARGIEAAIAEHLGLTVPVLLRTHPQLAAVAAATPLGPVLEPRWFAVTFLSEAADPEGVAALDAAAYLPDEFSVVGAEVYQRFAAGQGQTKLGNAFWERRLRVVATARNWNTVLALRDLSAP